MYINTHVNELRYIVNGDKPFTMYSTYMYSVASIYIIYMVRKKVSLLDRGVLYVEVILYSKECNWYTRCCPLNGGVCYRECGYTVCV